MSSSTEIVIKVLADVGQANAAFSGMSGNIAKVLGSGGLAVLGAATTQAAMTVQSAMARVQQAYNAVDFAPGTQSYIDAHSTIERMSTLFATSFTDVAASMAQAAKVTDEYGNKLPVDKVNEFVEANLRLKASGDGMDALASGQYMSAIDKMYSSTDYKGTASMVAQLSTQHPQDEESLWQGALGIAKIGAPLGVTLAEALGIGNFMSDLMGGGQTGGASIGRMLLRMDTSADQVLDPESKYADVRKARDAQEKLDDLQTSLKEAEAKHAQMFGQHGLKTEYKKNPAAVMAEDDRIAKLHREIADQQADIAHENDPNRSWPRGKMNLPEMAKTAGQTAEDYANLFKAHPIDALLAFTEGLHNLPASERGGAETKAGITNTKDQTTIDLLSDQPASVRRQILMAQQEQANPTAIDQISNIGLGTTAAKVTDASSKVFSDEAKVGEPLRQKADQGLDWFLHGGAQAAEDKVNEWAAMFGKVNDALRNIPGVGGAEDLVSANPALEVILGAGGVGVVQKLLPALLKGAAGTAATAAGGVGPMAAGAAGEAGELLGMFGKVLGPAGVILGIGLEAKGLSDNIDALLHGQPGPHFQGSQAPGSGTNITIGDIHVGQGQSLDDVMAAVTSQITMAWNAALGHTPVTGAMGGTVPR